MEAAPRSVIQMLATCAAAAGLVLDWMEMAGAVQVGTMHSLYTPLTLYKQQFCTTLHEVLL